MNKITPEMLESEIKKRLEQDRNQRKIDLEQYKKVQNYKECSVCGFTSSRDEICFICTILANPAKFESKPWYNRVGDTFCWYFEDVDSYIRRHPQGGLRTMHAIDDNRIVGFQLWNAASFCSMLYKLIMSEDDSID